MTILSTRRSLSLACALIISFLLGACTLTGAPEQSLELTDVPTNTVQPTRTPAGSAGIPTSRPTVTSLPLQQPQQPTRSVILPPTAVPPAQASTPVPISIVILSPVPGSIISGNTQILGAASHPQFLQYQVEYGPQPNPGNLFFPITGTAQRPVNNGLLGIWNTSTVDDGLYNIRLRVTLRDGTSLSTVVGNIRVQNRQPTPIPTATTIPRPIAAFSQSATAGQTPLVVNFFNQSQGEITGYQWSFGDGGSSSEINPTYTYRNPGIYTVILTATGPGGASNVSRQISVQSVSPPVAAFTQDRVSGESPLVVQFTGQSTGNITAREWRFGDGATSTEQNPAHTFTEVGTYNVILSVEGPGGATSAIRQITVENPAVPAPDASFTASTTAGEIPLQVNFTPDSTANANTYDWRVDGETFSNAAQSQFTFTEAGTFTVELIVTGDGGQDTDQETITVSRPPDAPDVNISVNPESGDAPLDVQFTSESIGGQITSYTWDLGDGNFSNEASPAYTYTSQGTYEVTLVVEGPGGTDTETISVTAVDPVQPPAAAFDAIVVDDGVGLTIDFVNRSTGEGLTYAWDFGDGSTSSDESPQQVYGDYGTYTVRLSVTNSAGTATDDAEITLSAPLTAVTAVASAAPLQAAVGDTVQFDSSGSTGDIATYSWDFGDGNISDQPAPANIYQTPGEYTVTLALTGQDGSTSLDTIAISMGAGLQAAFTPQQASVTAGESVVFDSSTSTGNIVSYAWQFGDGGTSAEASPTYPYNTPGEYQVSLTVSDGATQSTATGTVSVSAALPPLQAAFTPQQASVTAGESVIFDSSGSTGNIVSYAWQFGDGGTSAEASPTYPYNAPGEYQVSLTVSDGATQSTATGTVSVSAALPPLQAAFTPQQASVTAGESVVFDSSTSTGNIVSYAWQFGDGGTSAEASPTYPYNAPGEYQVSLTVSDGVTQSTATGTVSVGAGLQAAFVANPQQANVGDTITFDASGSSGPISTFQWDFGDGNSSVDPAPMHPYQAPGEYTVMLTLTSVGGQVATAQQVVTINQVQPVSDPQIAFASARAGNLQIFVMNADGAAVERITDTGGTVQQASWSVNNELVYSLDGQLFISRVDDRSARPVSPDGGATVIQGEHPTWSPDGGRIAFTLSQPDGTADIAIVGADGTGQVQLTTAQGINRQPTWSPDGSRIAFSTNRDGNFEIYVMNAADGSNPVRLTDDSANDVQPSWSPDGGRIAFAADRGENNDREVYVMGADGSNPTRLTTSPGVDAQPSWRRDNGQIVFSSARDGGDREVYVMGADGSNPTRLTDQPGDDVQPVFRP